MRESERKRLAEILNNVPFVGITLGEYFNNSYIENCIADHLLDNGVVVPPCKVGDKVYYVTTVCDEEAKEYLDILDGEVASISIQKEKTWVFCRYECGLTYWHTFDDIGKTVFPTKEEAEAKLQEGKQ